MARGMRQAVPVAFVCLFLGVLTWLANGKWGRIQDGVGVVGEEADVAGGVVEAGEVVEVGKAVEVVAAEGVVGTLDAGTHSYFH